MRDPDGVPLASYIDTNNLYGVRFECLACGATHDVTLAAVLARLAATGLGGPGTGVRAVGRLSTRPCARCGAVRWATRPVHRPILTRARERPDN